MKPFLLASALALSAMTTVALAESVTPAGGQAGPVPLTAAQLDTVTAGAQPKYVQKAQRFDNVTPSELKKGEPLGQAKKDFP